MGYLEEPVNEPKRFSLKADLKMQVLKVIDALGVASKLKYIREKPFELTNERHNIWVTLRTLNKHKLLKLLQPKGKETIRGVYWVKTEWLEDSEGRLKDKQKFEGFELLFTDEQIKFKSLLCTSPYYQNSFGKGIWSIEQVRSTAKLGTSLLLRGISL